MRVFISLILCLSIATPALAESDYLGIFTDAAAQNCSSELSVGAPDTLFILAILPDYGDEGITAVEFAIGGLPPIGSDGIWQIEWNSDLVLGDPEEGIAIAFPETATGEIVEIGRIILHAFNMDWIAPDHRIGIMKPPYFGTLSIVTHEFDTIPVSGAASTLNCSDAAQCECEIPACAFDPAVLDFGFVLMGSAVEHDIMLRNRSDDTISGTISTPYPPFFLSGGGPFTLANGDSVELVVEFSPDTEIVYEDVLTTDSGCGVLPIHGRGATVCTVLPASPVELGEVALGEFLDGELTISRAAGQYGYDDLIIAEESDHLTLLRGGGEVRLTPGDSHTVEYRYHPMTETAHAMTITFDSNNCDDFTLHGNGIVVPGSHVTVMHLGLYENPNASGCGAQVPTGEYTDLHLVAVLPEFGELGVAEASFRLDNLPPVIGSNGQPAGYLNLDWGPGSEVLSGDIWSGLTVRFDPPRTGRLAILGVLRLRPYSGDWITADLPVSCSSALPDLLFEVVDGAGASHTPLGAAHVLNCSDPAHCACGIFDAAACAVWPPLLDFGDVVVGQSAVREFFIGNTGPGTVSGTIASSCGQFNIIGGGGPFELDEGEFRDVSVRFAPVEIGPAHCTVETGLFDCGTISCDGIGEGEPICVIEPLFLEFGEVKIGEWLQMEFTIRNEGGGVLAGEVQPIDSEHFQIVTGGGPFILDMFETLLVTIRFEPVYFGRHEAFVDFGTEDCPEALAIAGQGRPTSNSIDHFGIYADVEGAICNLNLSPGIIDTIHVIARLPALFEHGVSACRFGISGLPPIGDLGAWSAEWDADTVTGDVETGLELRFDTPLVAEEFELGRIIVVPESEDWVESFHEIEVVAGAQDSSPLVVTPGEWEWAVIGTDFYFNCYGGPICLCEDFTTPVCLLDPEEINFGQVPIDDREYRDFSITNTGYGILSGEIAVYGSAFGIVDEDEGPFALGVGETLTITVSFRPRVMDVFHGTVTTGLEDCPEIDLVGEGTVHVWQANIIGCYGDPAGTTCSIDVVLNEAATVYIYLNIPYLDDEWIESVAFRMDDLPLNLGPPFGTIEFEWWYMGEVSGNPWDGIELTFEWPRMGATLFLGTMEVTAMAEDWIDEPQVINIRNPVSGDRPIVTVYQGSTYYLEPSRFTFNCQDEYYCECYSYGPSPVLLSLFEAKPRPGAVDLRWETNAAVAPTFRLEAEQSEAIRELTVDESTPGLFSASDEGASLIDGGKVSYRLYGRETGEEWQLLRSAIVQVPPLPLKTELLEPHPNPFNPSVTLPFTLSEAGRVSLVIYDVAGRRVRVIFDERMERGRSEVEWKGDDESGRKLGSGVYFARLLAPGHSESKRVVLLK